MTNKGGKSKSKGGGAHHPAAAPLVATVIDGGDTPGGGTDPQGAVPPDPGNTSNHHGSHKSKLNAHAANNKVVRPTGWDSASKWAKARPTGAYVKLCGLANCSALWSNGVLLLFGTIGLMLWCMCVVALFSFKSAVHVYTYANATAEREFEAAVEGDGCFDKSAFVQLSLMSYVNFRLALLALGVLPAAAWAFKKALDWCEHNTFERLSDDEIGNFQKEHKVGQTKAHSTHKKTKDDKTHDLKFNFCSTSFQTVAGISVFNFLSFVALFLDCVAIAQWGRPTCNGNIKKLKADMFDPAYNIDMSQVPVLMLCTNLLAAVMGTFTCMFGCTHACDNMNRQLVEAHKFGQNNPPAATEAQFFAPMSYDSLYGYRPVPSYYDDRV